ncbi:MULTISPECIES: diguanylate cyclase [Halomonadaceae]|uniref:diguanylate cyclase n=1 Tax=Halomonadaceae TaxID=28256 RepID=UPI001597CD6B|nr:MULTISPECIES: diguanylate cyclase [Halomonas]QJQ94070.1 diguanylate cyclase [Halomonas sp. PA5]
MTGLTAFLIWHFNIAWASTAPGETLGPPINEALVSADDSLTDSDRSRPQVDESGRERVTLQLPWYPQFQFAGYYAALERGYYRDAGLDVEVRHTGSGTIANPVEEVIFNRAEFGVSRSDLLVHHSEGLPVAVLANIMQRSALTFLTLERYGFDRLEEIGDRPVSLPLMENGEEHLDWEILATLYAAGVDPEQLNNASPNWQVEGLIDGTTQLLPIFSTTLPYFIRQYGEEPVEIHPSEYGIDFYGDLLFTHQQLIEQRPALVKAFREASLHGWRYALTHIDEVAELIDQRYETQHAGYDIELLREEAQQLIALMQPELIEIGHINPTRWEAIAHTYQSLDIIDEYDLESFLYSPERVPLANDGFPNVWRWAMLALSILTVAVALAFYLHMMNRELRREMQRRKSAEDALRHQAEKDGLTGIDNRRLFEVRLQQEFDRARRHGRALSIILFDVDHFKRFNDSHGHLLGDQVLIQIATVTQAVLRSCDHFARYGGEEFVVVLPDTDLAEAGMIANRIWQANREHRVVTDSLVVGYTLSLGVATISLSDKHGHDLLQRADTQLYRAKESGRDRCCKAE